MSLNLKEKFEQFFKQNEKSAICFVGEIADKHDYKAVLVGGIVRDLLLNKKNQDIDILIEGNAIEFCNILERNGAKIVKINEDLKTAKVEFKNNITIDFASTRKEKYPKAGCLPIAYDIGCPLIEDIRRRDFTINTLYFSINQNRFGDIFDFLGGLDDIKNRKIKILHPKSFIDDPTRIIRGLKFRLKLGFDLENHTKQLQEDYLNSTISKDICTERLKSEFIDIFDNNYPNAYKYFISEELYKLFFIHTVVEFNENLINSALNIKKIKNKWLIYFGLITTKLEQEDLNSVIEAFYLTANEKNILMKAKELVTKKDTQKTNFDIYKFFEKNPLESILIYYLQTQNIKALKYLNKLQDISPEINGDDLINLGIKPSKEFKNILDEVLKQKLNVGFHNKNDEICYAKELIKKVHL